MKKTEVAVMIQRSTYYPAVLESLFTTNTALDRKAAQKEAHISRHISQLRSSHQGRAYVRVTNESFDIQGPHGEHTCLVLDPLREPLWLLGRRFGGVIPPALLKPVLRLLLLGLDFLHTECRVIHTGVSCLELNGSGSYLELRYSLGLDLPSLGPPPFQLLEKVGKNIRSDLFSDNGDFRYPELIPPEDFTFSNLVPFLDGENKQLFLGFARRMLQWDPERRATARELCDDPWLDYQG